MANNLNAAHATRSMTTVRETRVTTHRHRCATSTDAPHPFLPKEREMKMPVMFPAAVLAATLGLGLCTGIVQAQTTPDPDHSATIGQVISDTWITAKIKGELATTKGVESTDVTVDTTNRVVTLTGVLATETAVKKAIAVAKSVKGVKEVDASGLKVK